MDDKSLKEEGSLHAAMALQGLAKMDRYTGETCRGARFTPEESKEKFAVGKQSSFSSLASPSSDKAVALEFAHGLTSEAKPTAA